MASGKKMKKAPYSSSEPTTRHATEHPPPSAATTSGGTRLCLKNLPPHYTDKDLRNWLLNPRHYAGERPVLTDCKVLQGRRMAFCGLATAEQAATVLNCFDRTYCGTSRQLVEYALPKKKQLRPDESQPTRAETATSQRPRSSEPAAATSKKFWANDDGVVEEAGPPKQEVEPRIINDKEVHVSSDASSDSESSSDNENQHVDDEDSDADDADPLANRDLDFLRSKQLAVLDLDEVDNNVKDDTDLAQENEENNDESSTSSSSGSSSDDSSTSSDEPSLKDAKDEEDPTEEIDTVRAPADANAANQLASEEPEQDDDKPTNENDDLAPNRLFVRNLPFSTTAEELQELFETFGAVQECHLPLADSSDHNRGYAFVTLATSEAAATATNQLDGTDFQGRLLHILPARRQPQQQDHAGAVHESGGYRSQKEQERQEQADSNRAGWSASFVRGDAVVDHLSSRLGLSKGNLLDVKDGMSAGEAAVRLALGETAVIEENRSYFAEHGVDLEALVSAPKKSSSRNVEASSESDVKRSKISLLVKNLPHDTTQDELSKLFAKSGSNPSSILLPPSRTLALVEFETPSAAKAAFRRLAYRRFKSVPVYLEWAPLAAKIDKSKQLKESKATPDEHDDVDETLVPAGPVHTLYVKNLSFATTEERLYNEFSRIAKDVRAVRIPQKVAPVKSSRTGGAGTEPTEAERTMSMGYGFVEFASLESVQKLLKMRQGMVVDGHALELALSGKSDNSPARNETKKETSSKIMVRNVPFQATRTDLLKLFGSFGQLKKVRLPKKFDGTPRGFAFVEYTTSRDAVAAKAALSRTHLYGRHLVLEWADDNDEDGNMAQVVDDKTRRAEQPPTSNKRTRFD